MNSKLMTLTGIVAVVMLFGFMGFISGRQRVSLGEPVVNTSKLNLSLPGMKVMPNPSDKTILDVRVEITEGAKEIVFISTAYEIFCIVDKEIIDNKYEFEKVRLQICSGHWQTDYIFPVGISEELKNKNISVRKFWVETINNETPKLKMINTIARPSAFTKLASALFVSQSIGTKSVAEFTVAYGKNVNVNLILEDENELFDIVSTALICLQASAEETNIFLDKISIYVKTEKNSEVKNDIKIKFDYRYLDMLAGGKLSVADFMEHVYIE